MRTPTPGRPSTALLAVVLVVLSLGPAWSGAAAGAEEPRPARATAGASGEARDTGNKKKAPAHPKRRPATSQATTPRRAEVKPKSKSKSRGKTKAGATARATPSMIPVGAPQITPFPQDHVAVAKAFADHRRQQLGDAERAARSPQGSSGGKSGVAGSGVNDRWRTVLFEIRELDSRSDPEACFWRVLAYYRLGEVARARSMRLTCELPAADATALEAEDSTALALQPEGTVAASERGTSEPPLAPDAVTNGAAYAGPGPARFK